MNTNEFKVLGLGLPLLTIAVAVIVFAFNPATDTTEAATDEAAMSLRVDYDDQIKCPSNSATGEACVLQGETFDVIVSADASPQSGYTFAGGWLNYGDDLGNQEAAGAPRDVTVQWPDCVGGTFLTASSDTGGNANDDASFASCTTGGPASFFKGDLFSWSLTCTEDASSAKITLEAFGGPNAGQNGSRYKVGTNENSVPANNGDPDFIVAKVTVNCVPDEPKENISVDVAMHIVKRTTPGEDCAAGDLKTWLTTANEVWARANIRFEQQGTPDVVQKVGDQRKAGAHNIYCVDVIRDFRNGKPITSPGRTNLSEIEIVRAPPDTTLAHELGHRMSAIPDSTTSDHGTRGSNGLDTDGDGDFADAADRKNIMYPGSTRIGQVVDGRQAQAARTEISFWFIKEDTKDGGGGSEKQDAAGDASSPEADITFAEYYFSQPPSYNSLIMSVLVGEVSTTVSTWLGFRINADNSTNTGEAPDGADYRVAYNPASDTLVFEKFGGAWSLHSGSLSIEPLFLTFDEHFDPVLIGYSFGLPLEAIDADEPGAAIAAQAFASAPDIDDTSDLSVLQTIERPGVVGGIPRDSNLAGLPLETADSPGSNAVVLAGVVAGIAAAAFALGGAGWYGRKRWLR